MRDRDFREIEDNEEEETKRRFPGFILLLLFTTVGLFIALGVSFSAFKFLDSNETINTLISNLTGNDDKDKYIITYIEGPVNYYNNDFNASIYISDAKFHDGTNGGSGKVIFYEGLMLTTQSTFTSKNSTVTYAITLTNNTSVNQIFDKLIYDQNGKIKYTLSGIKQGDIVESGKSITVYLTLENTGDGDFPTTIESSTIFSFKKEEKDIYISKAEFQKGTNGGKGTVISYEGLSLTTKNTFESKKSTITYAVTLTNDSSTNKIFDKLIYNQDDNIKYTLSGIKQGDVVEAGKSITVYLTLESTGDGNYPTTIETSTNFNFKKEDKTLHISDAKFQKGTNGGTGKVTFYEGLMLTTESTFKSKKSTVTYAVTLTNDSSENQVFDKLIYNPDGDVKYSLKGIKSGDIIAPGKSITVYLTLENTGDGDYPKTVESTTNFNFNKEEKTLHISDAKFHEGTNGGTGTVVAYKGLALTTKSTFESKDSTVTYAITLTNDSSVNQVFDKLIYNPDGKIKYTLTGINQGDVIEAGKSIVVYLTLENTGDGEYPTIIESSTSFNFNKEDGSLHIAKADFYEGTNGGTGKVVLYSGLLLTTENTFTANNSTITYEVTLKNSSKETATFHGLIYNKGGDVKYSLKGIKEGDKLASGESIKVYLTVENNKITDFPTTIESSISFDFSPDDDIVSKWNIFNKSISN